MTTISVLPIHELPEIRELLRSSAAGPYRFLKRSVPDDVMSYWEGEIEGWVNGDNGRLFAAHAGDRLVGAAVYADLPWDSRVFGRPMGAVKNLLLAPDVPDQDRICDGLLNRVDDWARAQGRHFLLSKTYTDDVPAIHAMERNGFLMMDTLLYLVLDVRRAVTLDEYGSQLSPGLSLRVATEGDLDDLVRVAHDCFKGHFGRYNADPRMPGDRATLVYEEWMRSSIAGFADWIQVAEVDGALAGFTVWRKPREADLAMGRRVGHYSIGAVHPDFGGRGIFTALSIARFDLFDPLPDYIDGYTHVNNYPVHRGMLRVGYRIADATHSFHKWLDR